MNPIITPIIVLVAQVILKHHIKESWVGKILPFLFPKKTYQTKLEDSTNEIGIKILAKEGLHEWLLLKVHIQAFRISMIVSSDNKSLC
ncbi:MAG: hypothetical protein KAH17_10380 [Bacteroidales bacterium]|nr:hypothetical protein [Bacteroidales bacterium]